MSEQDPGPDAATAGSAAVGTDGAEGSAGAAGDGARAGTGESVGAGASAESGASGGGASGACTSAGTGSEGRDSTEGTSRADVVTSVVEVTERAPAGVRDDARTTDAPLLSVRGLKVHFPIKRGVLFDRTVGHVKAVDGVDLDVQRGRTFGLVGESGCGKSTLGRAILRLTEPTAGKVIFDGTELTSLREEQMRRQRRRMQMVFQDPLSSLDPRQNVESLLTEPMRAHGLVRGREALSARVRELLDRVGLPVSASYRYAHEFSGGQRQRIGIARALALEPDLIVADEPVSALDVSIQAQVLNLLEELQEQLGVAYIVIAHDLAVVRHISDEVGVMYLGGIVERTDSRTLYEEPLHPYTRALMSAVPIPDPEVEEFRERILLYGDLPSPANPPSGCRFRTRCPWRQDLRCADEVPALRELRPGHTVACHWAEEIASGEIHPRAEAIIQPTP